MAVVGAFDNIQGTAFYGWALNLAEPTKPVILKILVDGIVAGECIADIFRPDLASNQAQGKSAFKFIMPVQFCDGKDHTISVVDSESGAELQFSPRKAFLSKVHSKAPACVVTQALSAGFYFPKWYEYYSQQIGAENIYVITGRDTQNEFESLKLGGLITYPSNIFDDSLRQNIISSIVTGLLECYDAAIVVDSDEFAVPDPRKYNGLLDFLSKNSDPYITSIGFDISEITAEKPLNLDKKIVLEQRDFGYLTSSISKTSITRIPMRWNVGFHYASVYPKINELFLLHLKRADKNVLFKWMQRMSKLDITNEVIRDYYNPEWKKLEDFVNTVSAWPVVDGWDNMYDKDFISDFHQRIKYYVKSAIYCGEHFVKPRLIKIPKEFRGVF